jgi:CheY-like chemotaxis protein
MYVARILHVEDDETWRDLIKSRLVEHRVDSAKSLEEAMALLQKNPPYDLALVDLNLEGDSDLQGGELLDLLRERYRQTRRVVMTGTPPPGSVRRNVFERYDVDEIMIKGALETPDLFRIVLGALSKGNGELSPELKLQRSELRIRYREWSRQELARLKEEVRSRKEHVYDARKVSAPSGQRANEAVLAAEEDLSKFSRESDRIQKLIEDIGSIEDLVTATDALASAQDSSLGR